MDDDDFPVGRVLSRREVWALLGGAGAALLGGCGGQPAASQAGSAGLNREAATAVVQGTQAAPGAGPTAVATQGASATTATTAVSTGGSSVALPACVVRPEMTEGPYYVAEDLVRSDVRSDPSSGALKPGAPLVLTFDVSQVSSGACTPLPGATVEIWQCDATGVYSDVADPGFNTKGQKFLRGAQVTDASGACTFTTIYPGWYSGRAIHIHFKVRPTQNAAFTSQLFFDDALSDQVLAQAPYASKGKRDTPNSRDSIFRDGGSQLLLSVIQSGQGYAATFPIAMDLSKLGAGQPAGGPGAPAPGRPPGGPPPSGR